MQPRTLTVDDRARVDAFVAKWAASQGSERANKDAFLIELCELLDVPRPDPKTGDPDRDLYVFERDVPTQQAGGKTTKFIDLYKAGHFVLEAKQFADASGRRVRRETPQWHAEMQKAHGQALGSRTRKPRQLAAQALLFRPGRVEKGGKVDAKCVADVSEFHAHRRECSGKQG